jgi:hypothetical protein
VYSIQYYMIKFVSDLRFSLSTQVSWPPRYNWNIVEIDVTQHNHNTRPLEIMDSNPSRVKPKTINLVFVASHGEVYSGFIHQWNWPPDFTYQRENVQFASKYLIFQVPVWSLPHNNILWYNRYSMVNRGFKTWSCKTKTINLVCVASPLSTQH